MARARKEADERAKMEAKSKSDNERRAKQESEERMVAEAKAKAEAERRSQEQQRLARVNTPAAPATPPAAAVQQPASRSGSEAAAVGAAPRSRNQRLAELLDRYRRDQISPSEYHQQRAKIIAEPQ
jgi:hypothetical protein